MGAHVNRQPVGAVACISPYNFPLTNMAGKIAPALAVGNTVVMKPAPQDPLAIIVLAEILHEVGLPARRRERDHVGRRPSPRPRSARAATSTWSRSPAPPRSARIYEAGGTTMKRLLLELGGKGAALVLDDADVNAAVTADRQRLGVPPGQICTAPTRAIVHRSKYDELVERPRRGRRAT